MSFSGPSLRIRSAAWPLHLAIVVGLAILAGIWLVGAGDRQAAYLMLGMLAAAIMVIALTNWRAGVLLFFTWLLFEDLARKFLGNSMIIYFGKDVLVAVCFFAFFFSERSRFQALRRPWAVMLAVFFGLGLIQVFNPNSPSIFYGLLGLKLYFYYVPLVFLGYGLLRSRGDLDRFLVFTLAVAALIASLGIVQAIVGHEFLNPADLDPELRPLGQLTRYSPITGMAVTRPTGVFVSDGRFGWYLILMWILGLGSAGYLFLRRQVRGKVVLLSAAAVFVGLILTGSRGAFLYALATALAMAAAFLWGTPWMGWQGRRLMRAMRTSLVLAGAALILAMAVFPEAVGARWAFYSETLSPYSPRSELIQRGWNYPVGELVKAFSYPEWPLGYGIGTASLGVQYLQRYLNVPSPGIGVESGYGTLVLEMGVPGLVLWWSWTALLLAAGWRVVRWLRGTPYFPIGFAILWFVFLLLFPFTYGGIQAYQNFVYNAYLWLLVGVLFRLPELPEAPRAVSPGETSRAVHG